MLSTKTLTKQFEHRKDVTLQGLFDEDKNIIYVGSNLPEDVKLHVFFHELSHLMYDSFQRLESEEAVADMLGSYLLKISGAKTLEEFLTRMESK